MNSNSLDNEDITRYVAKFLWIHTLKYIAENPLQNITEYFLVVRAVFAVFAEI